jgi:V8-like Glu-specific endopeptidase
MSPNHFHYPLIPLMGIVTTIIVQHPITLAESRQEDIATIAQATTVLIEGQNSGSGVIVGKEGEDYSVLTAKHVVATPDEYKIIAPDGKIYSLDYGKVRKLPDLDLAIVHFNSGNKYEVAPLGNSAQVSLGNKIYVAGWPHPEAPINESLFVLTEGNIAALAPRPLPQGYQLVYTNITRVGMSGGPIFNVQGQLVGIHGQAQGRRVYLENYQKVDLKSGFNLGIPVQALLLSQEPIIKTELPQKSTNTLNQEPRLYWSKAPRLIDSGTTQNGIRVHGATYYFTVSIPDDAGAPLQQLTFAQTEWADFWETYRIEETKAFEGTRQKRGHPIPLEMVSIDDDNRTVTVTFSPPIAPGKTVTIGLRPYSTPSVDGVYLFGITAFPPGGLSRSLFLGVARFHFYSPR